MNVLFLSLAPIASLEDRGIYPDLLRIFVKNGHFVRIISVQPDRATYDDRREGYAVLHVQTPQMQKVGLLKKGIASLQIGPNIRRALDRHCRNERYDLILMATPPITLVGVVAYIKKRDGAKFYLLLKDIWPQGIADLGAISQSGPVYRYFRAKEKKLYALADQIGCMSPANVKYAYLSGKTVLVTGGGGSIGSELCRQIVKHDPKELVIVDIYENNAYDIQQELLYQYGGRLNLKVEIASIRDRGRMRQIFATYRPDVVFHAAAHKHVPLMENSPQEAIRNNVFGTLNLVRAADKFCVQKFLLISTDKAVNPTSVMGASKRLCEMILQSMKGHSGTDFVAVRFGNVLGSNGSVVPLFQRQIAAGGPITVTDKRIIRYFMTIPEAAQLVLQTGAMARKNELFVLNMGQPVKILDLAENMIRLSGYVPYRDIDIVETGLRPGEKLYEELLIASRDIEQTENSQIFIERQPAITPGELREKLEILQEALEKDDSSCIREALHRVVPTFHEPEEVNCGQGAEVRIPQQAAFR